MNSTLFRKSSLDKISSPEQLNDYIRVTNPSVWVILGAIIALLVGVCIWGIFGTMDMKVQAPAVAKDGHIVLYLTESQAKKVNRGDEICADGQNGTVSEVSQKIFSYEEMRAAQGQYADAMQPAPSPTAGFYEIKAEIPQIVDGVTTVEITAERIKPMTFLLN
ncbi:MAG: hypothetical protein RSB47_00915 [Ruthenibacterium sp.]